MGYPRRVGSMCVIQPLTVAIVALLCGAVMYQATPVGRWDEWAFMQHGRKVQDAKVIGAAQPDRIGKRRRYMQGASSTQSRPSFGAAKAWAHSDRSRRRFAKVTTSWRDGAAGRAAAPRGRGGAGAARSEQLEADQAVWSTNHHRHGLHEAQARSGRRSMRRRIRERRKLLKYLLRPQWRAEHHQARSSQQLQVATASSSDVLRQTSTCMRAFPKATPHSVRTYLRQ